MEQAPSQGLLQLKCESQGSNPNLAHEMPELFKLDPKTNPRVLRPILQGPSLKGPSPFFLVIFGLHRVNKLMTKHLMHSKFLIPCTLIFYFCSVKGYV